MNVRPRLLATLVLVACVTPTLAQNAPAPPPPDQEKAKREQVRKEVDEAAIAIRDYSEEQRKEAVARARVALAEMDRRAGLLQARIDARWDRMNATARRQSEKMMDELRARRIEAAEWTGALQHGSREAWGEVKTGFLKSYEDLAAALNRARDDFERSQPAQAPPEQKSSSEKLQENER